MEFIKELSASGFTLFNVDETKRPINALGYTLNGWSEMSAIDAQKEHNYNSSLWGIRAGLHSNNRYIMSLDFDCCGKSVNGVRVGCEYTKTKLKEYMEFGIWDGMFSSSTKGNMNVLVDYTNCPSLQLILNGKSKFKRKDTDLEILFGTGHQQVIPPSTTKCKISGIAENKRVFLNSQPLLVLNEETEIFVFIKSLFDEEPKAIKTNSKTKTKNVTVVEAKQLTTASFETEDEYLDLLFNVIKNEKNEKGEKLIDWDTWFQICGILKTNGYDVELFIKYSESNSSREEALKLWNSTKKMTMSIYGLRSIAKKVNPDGYNNWIEKYIKFIDSSTLEQGENDVAKHIAPQLKDKLKYCNKIWYYCDNKLNLWEQSTEPPFSIVITHLQNEIAYSRSRIEVMFAEDIKNAVDEAYRNNLEDKRTRAINIYNKAYRDATGSHFSSQLLKILKYELHQKDFNEMLDNNPYEIAYRNGILNLNTLQFREGLLASDYITKTIPFDYEVALETDVAKVREEIKKICNYNETHLNYYLSILGYSLTGDASRKQEFYYLRGQKASNGKSVVFENLSEIMPNYVGKIQNDIFDKKNTTRHKSVEVWSGLRLGWTNELTTEKKDAEFLKDVSDGTSIKYKKMYGTEQKMPISFKPFVVSNHTINIDSDAGVKRRNRILQMDSDFIENLEVEDFKQCRFKKDDAFGLSLRTTYKHALLHLLFSYSKKFVENNYQLCEYPKEWKDESDEAMKTNNKFLEWFEDNFEIFNGSDGQLEDEFKISKAKFEMELKGFGGKVNFKDEVKKNRWSFTYDSQKKMGGNKGVWNGFKAIVKVLDEA